MNNHRTLSFVYLAFAIAGLIWPWYYNLQFMLNSDEPFTITRFLSDGMHSPLSSSSTVDLLIGASVGLMWMIIEGARLKMRYLWLYFGLTFLIAFAFTFPFFLFMRERKLMAMSVV